MYSVRDTARGGGFPHSEIRGSKLVRSSPRLIAAYHVLHRLLPPRHPPDALKALDRSRYRCPPLGSPLGRSDHVSTDRKIRLDLVLNLPTCRRRACSPPCPRQVFLCIHDVKEPVACATKALISVRIPGLDGGARRDRTDDLLLAKQALSQLSYGPAGMLRFARPAGLCQSTPGHTSGLTSGAGGPG